MNADLENVIDRLLCEILHCNGHEATARLSNLWMKITLFDRRQNQRGMVL
jgi:hypothetical protein